MKKYVKWLVSSWMVVMPLAAASADSGLVFVCHPGDHFSKSEVKMVFGGRIEVARPVDNKSLKQRFLASIDSNDTAYFSSWKKNFFRRGTNLPAVRDNDSEVIEFVRSQPGAMGYVSHVPGSVSGIELCGD